MICSRDFTLCISYLKSQILWLGITFKEKSIVCFDAEFLVICIHVVNKILIFNIFFLFDAWKTTHFKENYFFSFNFKDKVLGVSALKVAGFDLQVARE